MSDATPRIHLCLVQPSGYLHSMALLDAAQYLQHQFRRLGARVTLLKNRLVHDAVNVVFGAHLGFDLAQCRTHSCVFVNLEQLGERGAALPPAYLDLLRQSVVIDYDAGNLAAYGGRADEVPLLQFGIGGHVDPLDVIPLEERPIDLLFFGSMNERRQALIRRIEATGRSVTMFDTPVYGPERDHYIRQARAVLNLHFYDSARFEQVRAFQCLSLGTPVVSERGPWTRPAPAWEDCVGWVPVTGASDDRLLEDWFATHFGSPAWCGQARAQLAAFDALDPLASHAELLGFLQGVDQALRPRRDGERAVVRRLHLGSGKDYQPGWLNLDILPTAQPDAVLDLSRNQRFPLDLDTPTLGPVRLAEGELDIVYANNVLEHVPDLTTLMTQCLALLRTGGQFHIEVPCEGAMTAWQDPTHVRALNRNSWLYYTDWFWYLGWLEHRFVLSRYETLDERLQPCEAGRAAFMRVVLTKAETSLRERMTARTMRADAALPGIAEDWAMLCENAGAAAPAGSTAARPTA